MSFKIFLVAHYFIADHTALHGLWYLTGATTVAAALSYILNKNTFKIISKSGRKT